MVGILKLALIGAVFAQDSPGVALQLAVEAGTPNASVLCARAETLSPCVEAYAATVVGVVTDTPAAAFDSPSVTSGRYVLSSGRSTVRATQANGEIRAGDYVTSSETAGVVQKVTQNGYVLGVALGDFQPGTGDEGTVEVLIQPRLHSGVSNARSNLINYLRSGIQAPVFEPLSSLRYILAALLILVSFSLGFVYFGRMSKSGVEAIGRNPLASRMIQFQVVLNILVLIVVVAVGLAAAYFVLIL